MERHASCHCGQLVLRCTGEPTKVSLCHCLDCQRRTGSIFSVAAFFSRAQVAVATGTAKAFRRPSASGFDVSFHFCPECGSSLWWEPERLPHLVGVAAGAFADPDFPAPEQAVWSEDQHGWLELPPGIASHPGNPAHAARRE
ncbi:GFA family protein [Sphingopyxis sp.]|uniref:GFA family protein n=1 Tax=Sphingopyxis sp. TaxID=1908224 RepID=UPI002B471A90|nr:GFA family protein [Sphingopyxis sp.]HJS13326.1 GFA family protein [Sphingopyxis sp.]